MKNKYRYTAYNLYRKEVAFEMVQVANEVTDTRLYDLFTNTLAQAIWYFMLDNFTSLEPWF